MSNPKVIHNVTKQELPPDTTGWDIVMTVQPVNRSKPPDTFLTGLAIETAIYVQGDASQLEKYIGRMTKAILSGIKEKYGNDKAKETS